MARKNSIYKLSPVPLDFDYLRFINQLVRVIELPGCPRSKMPKQFAHVETLAGEVIGMVHVNSLQPLTDEQRKPVMRIVRDNPQTTITLLTRENGEWYAEAQI